MEYYIGEMPCGCRVYQAYQKRAGISYCPKHKAAEAMSEALEAIKWYFDGGRISIEGKEIALDTAKQGIDKALALARGE